MQAFTRTGEFVPSPLRPLFWLALALSVGAAVSLGVTRFAYGLLLPGMRTDLGWTYTLAGAMNTANAVGYLLGALAMPGLMRRVSPTVLLWSGSLLAALFMGLCGFFTDAFVLLVQRLLAGLASALVFVSGGLLAARLGSRAPAHAGLLLGVYYGGTGVGIVLSALLVPWVLDASQGEVHSWRFAWWALALLCFAATALLRWPARVMAQWELLPQADAPAESTRPARFSVRLFGFALAGYGLFGVGYIGYMTFAVALLRTQGASAQAVAVFYGLLGLAVVASSRIWAGLLNRHFGGGAMAGSTRCWGSRWCCLLSRTVLAWWCSRASCLAAFSCPLWPPAPPWFATTFRPPRGPRALVRSPSCLPPARLSAPRWWGGLPTARAVWSAVCSCPQSRFGWVPCWPGARSPWPLRFSGLRAADLLLFLQS